MWITGQGEISMGDKLLTILRHNPTVKELQDVAGLSEELAYKILDTHTKLWQLFILADAMTHKEER